MEFKVINSQEELNQVIKERLDRERENIQKKYADYDDIKKSNSDLETKVNDLTKQFATIADKDKVSEKTITDLTSKVKKYEIDSAKTKIALEVGLPFEVAGRLSGETEDDIRADANSLLQIVGKRTPTAPTATTEQEKLDPKREALKQVLDQAKNNA